MPNVLLTGACGFCGWHLARRLADEGGFRVSGVDLAPAPPAHVPLAEYLAADVTIAAELARAVRRAQPEWVFHLAGRMSGPAAEVFRVNLLGTIHLLEAVREAAPAARILLVGSAAEYGHVPAGDMPITEDHTCRPGGAYGLSKYAATLAGLDYARRCGMHVTVVRSFNVVGAGIPGSLVVGAILARAKKALATDADPVVAVGNLDTQRDFIAVEDAVEAYVRVMLGDHRGEVFNVCSGRPRTIRSIVERLLGFSARPIRLQTDPALVRSTDLPVVYGSGEKARRTFGFAPQRTLDDALRAAWEHELGRTQSCGSHC
jgi:GDP-4-dehydro-6-deoxy-D-mannose reductase